MGAVPRKGDIRPFKRDPEIPIRWVLRLHNPFRWLPRHGEPSCYLELTSQRVIKALALLPIYTAVIVTIVLLVQVFGIPFIGGR